MPFRHQWFDAPKDMSLIVHKKLPDGVAEDQLRFFDYLKEATGYVDGHYQVFHFCRWCGGWIEGHANHYEVDTLDSIVLAGRRGTEYYCCRCGEQIAFTGLMS